MRLAAAVAAGMVPLSLASQTGASIIRPASFCGVFGFKPSFGLIPRTGVLKTTDTLDTIGCIARSIDDLELLFNILRVHGRNYPYVHKLVQKKALPKKLRIGIFTGPFWDNIDADFPRDDMMNVETLAESILHVIQAPGNFTVEEMVVRRTKGDF